MALRTTYSLSCSGVTPAEVDELLSARDAACTAYEDALVSAYVHVFNAGIDYKVPGCTRADQEAKESEVVQAIRERRVEYVAREVGDLMRRVGNAAAARIEHLSLFRRDGLVLHYNALRAEQASKLARVAALQAAKEQLRSFVLDKQAEAGVAFALPFAKPRSLVWNAVLSIPSLRRGLDYCRAEHRQTQLEALREEEALANKAADYKREDLTVQEVVYGKACELLGDDAVAEMLENVDINKEVHEQQGALVTWLLSPDTPALVKDLKADAADVDVQIKAYEEAIAELDAGRARQDGGVRLSDLEVAEQEQRLLAEKRQELGRLSRVARARSDDANSAQTYVDTARALREFEAQAFRPGATLADKQVWIKEWLDPNLAHVDPWLSNEAVVDVVIQVYRAGMPYPAAADHRWLRQCAAAMDEVHKRCWRPTGAYLDNWQVGKFLPRLVQLGREREISSAELANLTVACIPFPGTDPLVGVLREQARMLFSQVADAAVAEKVFAALWAEGGGVSLVNVVKGLYQLALAGERPSEALQSLHDAVNDVAPDSVVAFNHHYHQLLSQRVAFAKQLRDSSLIETREEAYLQHFDVVVENYETDPSYENFTAAQASTKQLQDFAQRESALITARQSVADAELDLAAAGLSRSFGCYSRVADDAIGRYQTTMKPEDLDAAEVAVAPLRDGIRQELALNKRITRLEAFASALPTTAARLKEFLQSSSVAVRRDMYSAQGIVTHDTAAAADQLLTAVEIRLRDDIGARRLQDRLTIAELIKQLGTMFLDHFAAAITDVALRDAFQRQFAALNEEAHHLDDTGLIGAIYGGVVTLLLRMIGRLPEATEAGEITPELRRAMAELVTNRAFDLLAAQPTTAVNRYEAISDAHAQLKESFMGSAGDAGGELHYLGRGEARQTETTLPYYTGRFETPARPRAASEEDRLQGSAPAYHYKACSAAFYRMDWKLTSMAATAKQAALTERDALPLEKQEQVKLTMARADQTTKGNVASCGFWCAVARFCLLLVTFGQYDSAHHEGRQKVIEGHKTCAQAFSRVEAQLDGRPVAEAAAAA